MEKKTDRRVLKTKRLFRKSLLELMKTTPIEQITIAAICDYAEVNRNTFYYHYATLNDLLTDVTQCFFDKITDALTDIENIEEANIVVYKVCQENYDLLRTLLVDNAYLPFIYKLMTMECLQSQPAIHERNPNLSEQVMDMISIFNNVGSLALLSMWLKQGMPISPEELGKLVTALMKYGPEQVVDHYPQNIK